jgi:hypothetical protein
MIPLPVETGTVIPIQSILDPLLAACEGARYCEITEGS